MSAYQRSVPWLKRPSLNLIAAPVARLLSLARQEKRIPYDYREIEKFRIELELKRAGADLQARFKVM